MTHASIASQNARIGRASRTALLLAGMALLLAPGAMEAQDRWTSAGPAGHSPIGNMGDHTHGAGEWMAAYIYDRTVSSGFREGTRNLSVDEVWSRYRMIPLEMTMDMHMGHLMYAPTSNITLMGMVMWMDHGMTMRMQNSLMAGHHDHGNGEDHDHDHGAPGGTEYHDMSHSLSGWADTEIAALVKILDGDRRRVHIQLGLGIPTGSVTGEDDRMVPEAARMGYPMQLGSGSWEARPGITFLQQTDRLSLGAQSVAVVALNENAEGWKRGGRITGTAWAQLRGNDWVSPGVRVEGVRWGNVLGSDPRMDPALTPENDPALQGGKRVTGHLSLNFQVPTGFLKGHRLAVEWGAPLWESFEGPQLRQESRLSAGWEYAF